MHPDGRWHGIIGIGVEFSLIVFNLLGFDTQPGVGAAEIKEATIVN